jgi:DNA-binding transcriptional LysR family regulator
MAREAVLLLDEAAEGARQARVVPRGHLRVTAPHDFGLDVLPRMVTEFRAGHPQITVDLELTDARLDLAAHRIDLALRAVPGDLPDMAYRAVPLIDVRLALYAAPAYLAAHSAPGEPEDLERHDLIVTRESRRGAFKLGLTGPRGGRAEVLVRPAMHVSDYAAAHRLLVAGAGIAILPDIVAATSLQGGLLRPVLPDWTAGRARLHAISVAGREAPARVRAFLEFMRDRLARLAAACHDARQQ